MTVVGQVEIDEFCQRVLARHWPEVPRHDDVRTAVDWWLSEPRPRVDVIAGGYPCQPDSHAGKQLGINDERWLWPEMARVIHAVRPRYVVGENVGGHRTGGLRFVLRDLDRLGYSARAGTLRACEVGAPHSRSRVFVLAHANGIDGRAWLGPGGEEWPIRASGGGAGTWPDPEHGPVQVSARSLRVADGVPRGLDRRRVRAVGNAVVPRVAEHIGRLLVTHDSQRASRPTDN